jgi:carbamoyl-phosphate synthase large subunit
MHQNVLISCGGKWVGLVIQMREAMRKVPALCNGCLLVADREALSPAGCFADGQIKVPSITAPEYVEQLLDICERYSVRVLIPHVEIDVERLAPHIADFASIGTTLVGPTRELAELCQDKLAFGAFAEAEGLHHPRTLSAAELERATFPLFAKRQRGFGAIDARIVHEPEDARKALLTYPDLIFQEVIDAPELSIDAYIARDGCCVARIPRVRDQILGGESMRGHTIEPSANTRLADRTIAALSRRGLRGPLLLQVFATAEPTLLEVNPRIGSGTILGNRATNGNLFRMLLDEASGGVADGDPDDYLANLNLYRFYGDVFFDESRDVRILPYGSDVGVAAD